MLLILVTLFKMLISNRFLHSVNIYLTSTSTLFFCIHSSLNCRSFSLIGCKYVPSDTISKITNIDKNKAMKMIPIEPMVCAFLASAVGGSEGASVFGDEV